MSLLELLGWGAFLGGIPACLYYLVRYAKRLYERRKSLSNAVSDHAERGLQWQREVALLFGFCVLCCVGIMLCQWLRGFTNVQQ